MENDLIYTALQNLERVTGIQAQWDGSGQLGGILALPLNGGTKRFDVDVVKELRAYRLMQLGKKFRNVENYLILAGRISSKIKEELRQRGIPYIEANGNVFLRKEGVFLLVDTQKPLEYKKNTGNRAFTKTGLKVLFYLLQNKGAVNLTQRELAEKTQVALGNIPQILEGLKETGYLIPRKGKDYLWDNRVKLLERWIAGFETELRPRLKRERFKIKGKWSEINLNKSFTFWGGEPAADILTNYLRPEKFIIYTSAPRVELLRKFPFMPDKTGDLEVMEMFWLQEDGLTVPPLLVYADLIIEGGKRNLETAKKIYDEFVEPNL